MKDLVIGLISGVVAGYLLRKMEDDGRFRCLHERLHKMATKVKHEAEFLKDTGLDTVECVADHVHQMAEQEKTKKS